MQRAAGGLLVVNSVLLQDTPEGGEGKRETIFRREQASQNPLHIIFTARNDEEGAEKQAPKSAEMGCL